MRRLYEFKCVHPECEHNFDEYVAYEDIPSVKCPECGSPTHRLITAPRIDPRLGLDPSFPTMQDKWARVRRQRAKIESRRDE
jgi:putative FmdB family regulatory protein